MLLKVRYDRSSRRDIMENCQIMGAQIVDMSKSQMTIQMCDTPDRLLILITALKPAGILEISRTGVLAMTKCDK